MSTKDALQVTVAWITRGVQDIVPVTVDAGSTIADAVSASRLVETHGNDLGQLAFAVAGKRRRPDAPVHAGERIDLLRELIADPKDARRRRAARQISGSKRRPEH